MNVVFLLLYINQKHYIYQIEAKIREVFPTVPYVQCLRSLIIESQTQCLCADCY